MTSCSRRLTVSRALPALNVASLSSQRSSRRPCTLHWSIRSAGSPLLSVACHHSSGSESQVRICCRGWCSAENESGTSRGCIRSMAHPTMRFHCYCQGFAITCVTMCLHADLLVTAVDPNLGFTGCSYRAANWQQWMTREGAAIPIRVRPLRKPCDNYASGSAPQVLIELQVRISWEIPAEQGPLLDSSMVYCCSVNG